jgi:uncharacterized protein YecE (DUF72 family)
VKIYIGTSGWVYKHWRGVFYPEGLPQTKWLEFYTQHFSTVELNNTFYQLPSEKTFAGWRERSSPDFAYAVKVSRFITHLKKLRNVEEALGNFFSRAQLLGEKLGPLLYQLPPNMPRNDAILWDFLQLLPPRLHHVFEFRHESWFDEEIFDLLRKHKAGLCIFDMPGLITPVIATTDFTYIRFHGSSGLYSSCYADTELEKWAERIGSLGKDLEAIYIYFNNDAEGSAISNAKTLREKFRIIIEESR